MASGIFTLSAGSIYDSDIASIAGIQRVKMEQRSDAIFQIPLTAWRVWDALVTLLPGTSSADDLGLDSGTYATTPPSIRTSDLKAAGSTTRRARALLAVPPDFEGNATTITLRLYAGMVTTIADTAATVDVEAWRIDRDGTLGAADLVLTGATTMNALVASAKNFVLDTATLSAGDLLDVRVSILVNDAATVTAVIAALWATELLADLR